MPNSAAADAKRRLKVNHRAPTQLPPTPLSRSGTGSSSPDRSTTGTILVPSSSSPVIPVNRPKIRGPTIQQTIQRSNGASSSVAAGLIPSSGLNRQLPISNLPPSPSSSGGLTAGTPAAIMQAINNRRTAEDQPRTAGPSSLSYEGSKPAAEVTDVLSSPVSPSTPQLSRLKRRYEESPIESPYFASNAAPGASRPAARKPAALVGAAMQQYDDMIDRLCHQFDRVPRTFVAGAVKRYKGDFGRAVNAIEEMENSGNWNDSAGQDRASSPDPIAQTAPRPPQRPHSNASRPALASALFSPDPLALSDSDQPGNLSSPSSRVHTAPYRPPAKVPNPARVPPAPKPKRNEQSAIYANRGRKEKAERPKKRDPDEESSEGLASEPGGEASEAESEGSWSGDEGTKRKKRKNNPAVDPEEEAFKAFNEVTAEMLTGTISCSAEQADKIISLRPFEDIDDLRYKLNKARGVSGKLFEQYTEIMEGYVQIDHCLNRCEEIAGIVATKLAVWRGAGDAADSTTGTPRSDGLNDVKVDVQKVSELLKLEKNMMKRKVLAQYIQQQPKLLSEGTVLKDYQLLGVNWLNMMWTEKIGCILADEMGLGKTIQVIAFLAHLKATGRKGPHMIFVPASTLENWIREFQRFCPSIDVQAYYGSQKERAELREDLKYMFRQNKLEVVLASYTQCAAYDDLKFFRTKIEFQTCIYDEGHRLKNCESKTYKDLISIKPRWRLLLTGTPLQNNLQELVSLLMLIHKDTFVDAEPYLRTIFKSQGQASLLSQQRVSRARTMLTPFVLRRRKANVLQLPPKIETVEHCDMTKVQAKLYSNTLQRSATRLQEMDDSALEAETDDVETGSIKQVTRSKKASGPSTGNKVGASSHILMDLRKAACHPLLFRQHYDEQTIQKLAKACVSTPKYADGGFDYVVEDLEVMSDAEIHFFCTSEDDSGIQSFALDTALFLESGKVLALQRHIERCNAEGKRMLLFSQFTMVLDILAVVLDHLDVGYTRLDGNTKTDERQGKVDAFNDDPEITVFLLSTKAGGVGINLTAASVVIIFDQDFNPHNDRQAADRAYRIGQEKEVEVITLVSKGSIDEDMLLIGETKLRLDDAVGGDEHSLDASGAKNGASNDDQVAKEVKKSLLTTLRNKFEAGEREVSVAVKTGTDKAAGAEVKQEGVEVKGEGDPVDGDTKMDL